jgi:hypothetical protein
VAEGRSTVEILEAARGRITPPERWTNLWFARDAEGNRVSANSPDAVCWCVNGSLAVEYGVPADQATLEGLDAYGFLFAAAREIGDNSYPAKINDFDGHAATLAMCDRAVQLAEQEAS